MRHSRPALLALGLLLVVGNSGCESHIRQEMLVARIASDCDIPRLRSAAWGSEESVDCELASQQFERSGFFQSPTADDLLLCGQKTLYAWSLIWLRADIKAEVYRLAEKRSVDFRNTGHSRGWRGFNRYWNCRLASDHIYCQ